MSCNCKEPKKGHGHMPFPYGGHGMYEQPMFWHQHHGQQMHGQQTVGQHHMMQQHGHMHHMPFQPLPYGFYGMQGYGMMPFQPGQMQMQPQMQQMGVIPQQQMGTGEGQSQVPGMGGFGVPAGFQGTPPMMWQGQQGFLGQQGAMQNQQRSIYEQQYSGQLEYDNSEGSSPQYGSNITGLPYDSYMPADDDDFE